MSQSDLIDKLIGKSVRKSQIYNDKRLEMIQVGLKMLKQKNKQFLKKYQMSQFYQKIQAGLLKHGIQTSLEHLIEFKLCQANIEKQTRTYFNPFSKIPITVCYNKFNQYEIFEKNLSYNLVLYYDTRTRKGKNWNDLQQTVFTTARGLNLSGICKKGDALCIKKQLEQRVFEKERFKGKETELEKLDEIIKKALYDTTPISQAILREI